MKKGKQPPYLTRKFAACRGRLSGLIAQGKTQAEAAQALGVSRATVGAWMKRLALEPNGRVGKHGRVEAEVRALAESGLKRAAIARRLGLSPSTLDKMLMRLGVRTGPARYVPREKWEEAPL